MQVIYKLKVTYLLYETPLVWYICVMETALFGVTQLKVNNWNRAALAFDPSMITSEEWQVKGKGDPGRSYSLIFFVSY